MRRDDPYGLAEFGAELAGAKLYKNEKRLVAELTLSRLIGARETERICALLGAAVPDCAVELRAANAAALMAEGALSTVLVESWTHFSPLMRPVLINAVWEQAEPGSFAVHIPEKLYEAAKTYNGAARLTEFARTFYGLEIQVRLVPDAALKVPNPEQAAEPARGMAERGGRREQPERRMQAQAGAKKAAPARGGAKKQRSRRMRCCSARLRARSSCPCRRSTKNPEPLPCRAKSFLWM